MDTRDIKARLFDIERQIQSLEAEILECGKEFKELAWGLNLDDRRYAQLNVKHTMERAKVLIEVTLEKFEELKEVFKEKSFLEEELKRRGY